MSRWTFWIGFWALFALHHDVWLWNSRQLVFGFIPSGLLYQIVYSLAAVGFWACAARFAWPDALDSIDQDASGETAAVGETPQS